MRRFGRQWHEPFADHLRRPGEEAVGVRIVGRSHDFVRADIVGQDGDAPLDQGFFRFIPATLTCHSIEQQKSAKSGSA